MFASLFSKNKYGIAWIGLLAYLVMGLWNAPGMVLCFEKDGRVVLETAVNGICSDSFGIKKQIEKVVQPESTVSNLACKRCTDVPVSIGSAEPHIRFISAYQSPFQDIAVTETTDITSGYLAMMTETVLPQPPPLPPTIHRFLNTIVLLV